MKKHPHEEHLRGRDVFTNFFLFLAIFFANKLGKETLSFLFSLIMLFTGALFFFKGALRNLKKKKAGMMVLVSLGIFAGYSYLIYSYVNYGSAEIAKQISFLILVMIFGHWIEMLAIKRSEGLLRDLFSLLPKKAYVIRDGRIFEIDLNEIREGDVVFVSSGQAIPVDGIVLEGEASVDESLFTGEQLPAYKEKGSKVIGGSTLMEGSLKIRAIGVGESSFISRIVAEMREIRKKKTETQRIADKFADFLTIFSLIFALIGFSLGMNQGLRFALERLMAVLVIACPHALGLGIPLVIFFTSINSAKMGVILKDPKVIEKLPLVNSFFFDKTGTITSSKFIVKKFEGGDEALSYAASAESLSDHVLAKAIVKFAKEKNLPFYGVSHYEVFPGKGVKAKVKGKEVIVGSASLMRENGIKVRASRGTAVYVAIDGKLAGKFLFSVEIKEGTKKAIEKLKKSGIKTILITGDNKETAMEVARKVGIGEVYAELTPEDKLRMIRERKEKGKVAMVGDGINDALALSEADVGIAIGSGTNIAIKSADAVIIREDLEKIFKLYKLSRFARKKLYENLGWAAIYNIIAIPLAAGFLPLTISPGIAAMIMSFSDMIVIANSYPVLNYRA